MTNSYCIYFLSNKKNGTLYIGVTNNFKRRLHEHKNNLHKLVHYEETPSVKDALCREKQLKKWNRKWKIDLIIGINMDPRFREDDKQERG